MQRVFEAWKDESTVWLLPWAKKVARWTQPGYGKMVAIPSQTLEKVYVYHVSSNGYAAGQFAGERFPKGSIDSLLDAWLNYEERGQVQLVAPPKSRPFLVPVISKKGVTYREIVLEVGPRGFIPIDKINRNNKSVTLRWPPRSESYSTISPDTESELRFGPLKRADQDGTSAAVNNEGERSLFTFLRWPLPLRDLFPAADGVDNLVAQKVMADIAAGSADNLPGALVRCQQAASLYVFEGHSNVLSTEILPMLAARGEEAALAKAEDFGIAAKSLLELSKNRAYRETLERIVPIRRAWGPQGLMFALLLSRLESGYRFLSCQRCRRIIQPTKNKRYCRAEDNPACFRQRRADDQRRSRAAR